MALAVPVIPADDGRHGIMGVKRRSVEWGKRIICLYRPGNGRKLSGMIAGCDALCVHEYSRVDELAAVFRKVPRRCRSWGQ